MTDDAIYKWGLCSVCGEADDPVHIWRDGKLVAVVQHDHDEYGARIADTAAVLDLAADIAERRAGLMRRLAE